MDLENHMIIDSWRDDPEEQEMVPSLPICYCCDEPIRQDKALHIFYGRSRIWICDPCIKIMKESTGYEG